MTPVLKYYFFCRKDSCKCYHEVKQGELVGVCPYD